VSYQPGRLGNRGERSCIARNEKIEEIFQKGPRENGPFSEKTQNKGEKAVTSAPEEKPKYYVS